MEAEAIAAIFLGKIHRRIDILDQRFFVQRVGRVHGDADARSDPALVAVNGHRLDHGGKDFSRRRSHLRLIRHLAQHNDELVTADAGYHVALAHAFLQPFGGFNKQDISRGVAERIVYVFEAVEVHEHDGEHMTVSMSRFDRVVDRLAEHRAVWQSGKIVVGRQESGALLGFLAFRHILKYGHGAAADHRLIGERNNPAVRQQAPGMG